MKMCIVCHQRPAAVPDRERMGRPIKRVCRECHSERLRGDLKGILDGLELDRRMRQILTAVTSETVLSSTAALVELGFGAYQSFFLIEATLTNSHMRPAP